MNSRAFHRQRPLVCAALCFGLGIWAGATWLNPSVPLMLGGLLCALALCVLLPRTGYSAVPGACVAMLFFGMLYVVPVAHPHLPPEGKYRITARVSGESDVRPEDGCIRALLRQVEAEDEAGRVYRLPGAYWTRYAGRDAVVPLDGQTASFTGTLYHPDPQVNPHGFDFRMFLLQKNVPVGISGARDLMFTPEGQTHHAGFWLQLRLAAGDLLDRALGADSALAKALLIGDRTDLSEETNLVFRDAGIAHVLSVSGLHVGLLMAIVLFVLRRFQLPAAVLLVTVSALLLMYCRLLDFSAPVVRAAVLTVVMLLGRVYRRKSDPLTALAAAFMLVLLMRPLDLFSIGFQLSFLAVLGIVLLGDRLNALYAAWKQGRKHIPARDWLVHAYAVTLAASAFTALAAVLAFHRFSWVGLLVGPFACALIGFLMAAYVALMALGLIYLPLAQMLAAPVAWISRAFNDIIGFFAVRSWAVTALPSPPALFVLAAFAALVLLSRYVALKRLCRAAAMLAALLVAAGSLLLFRDNMPRYVQLSMGSADAAVIEDTHSTYVIDAGSHGGDLASYLLSRGRGIDSLFITHLHSDHAGGLRQLMDQRVAIGEIVVPHGAMDAALVDSSAALLREAAARGIPIRHVGAGDSFTGDRVSMRVLWPGSHTYPGRDANHFSLTMLWQVDGMSILTTGDLSAEYDQYAAHPAQVLKVAHHGSRDSTSDVFLSAVSPQIALITSSDTHAERAAAVTRKLEAAGCSVYHTYASGALILTADGESARITRFYTGGGP
ncbi:MAG: DNA internalization-related competence protein ComEC/Rec2 [Christensenellales bacterium]|jgi:competence protein ComEC